MHALRVLGASVVIKGPKTIAPRRHGDTEIAVGVKLGHYSAGPRVNKVPDPLL